MNYYLIGCGGIGGWLANAMSKTLTKEDTLLLIDGDLLEEKNLDRQLFNSEAVGQAKVDAMRGFLMRRSRCTIKSLNAFIGDCPELVFQPESWVLTGVDNHPARARTLQMCDDAQVPCINAANGYEDAEAFCYLPMWKDGPLDPRVYYPEILEDKADDPLAPPCTGEILESTPQLAIANMSAASYAMWLLWFWREKSSLLTDEDARLLAPVQVTSSAGRMRVNTLKDFYDRADALKALEEKV